MSVLLRVSAEQYPNNVVILQYCFLLPSNFMNTVIPQSTDIIKYSDVFKFFLDMYTFELVKLALPLQLKANS